MNITESPHSRPRILAVIVLYKISSSDCLALKSLLSASLKESADVHILLVDNTPEPVPTGDLLPRTTYISCPQNLGLANAYNRAIEFAERNEYTWLLTLDQDTELPSHFIDRVAEVIAMYGQLPSVAAIVPQIITNGVTVSPNFFQAGAVARWFNPGYVGVPKRQVYAFNSAATLRVAALRQAGGYDPYFWLDHSDARIFSKLHGLGKFVCVAGDLHVDHDFSVKNMAERVPSWRYRHMLLAESAFWDAHMNWLAGLERTLRLALRLIKHLSQQKNRKFLKTSLHFLGIRLFRSRAYRRRLFRLAVERHLGGNLPGTALTARTLKISVCMAAYNGAPFIRLQLDSILPQLSAQDEVIVVDDFSTDSTVREINAIADTRIRLIRHEKNEYLIRSFEDAIRNATGDIIFLSDNDDIWAANKVARFLTEFARDVEVQVVTSAVSLIDEKGKPFEESRWDRGGKFQAGFFRNVLKNAYQGSAMAFRSSLIASILPLPTDRGFLHDVWIGTTNDARAGKTAFIPEPLTLYRRHSKNVSSRLSGLQRLRSRVWLLYAHFCRAFRKV